MYILIFTFSDTGKETKGSEVNGSKRYLNLIGLSFLINQVLIFYCHS
jgi:hypothetical protein